MLNWVCSKDESLKIRDIARLACEMAESDGIDYDFMDVAMDLTATHLNGCPLDLDGMLNDALNDKHLADFGHDIYGIRRYLDRTTGQLTECFCPRYAKRATEE